MMIEIFDSLVENTNLIWILFIEFVKKYQSEIIIGGVIGGIFYSIVSGFFQKLIKFLLILILNFTKLFQTERHKLASVQLEGAININRKFIKKVKAFGKKQKYIADDFYIAKQYKECQWYGILKNWDIERIAYKQIKEEIKTSFADKYRQPKIITLIHGRGGSGKSTLANLLPRFYEATNGSITLDGVDINDYQLSSLRDQIALVTQNVTLFNDTIANNIAYGALSGTREELIIEAARKAHALEFIEEMPEGIHTLIGDNGVLLSGGQRQRLAIARALLKDAPILILDEATSALDTHSERLIQAALETVMKGRTTLVIAHRLSTIEGANTIGVIENGRLVELGSHAELLERDGLYAQLHNLQFSE
mgnify:CR=1 FL=1